MVPLIHQRNEGFISERIAALRPELSTPPKRHPEQLRVREHHDVQRLTVFGSDGYVLIERVEKSATILTWVESWQPNGLWNVLCHREDTPATAIKILRLLVAIAHRLFLS